MVAKRLGVEADSGQSFYAGAGCEECNQSGYRGRVGIYEVLPIPAELRSLVARNAPTEEIEAAARELGVRSLREDGLQKALNGETTLHEVLSSTVRG